MPSHQELIASNQTQHGCEQMLPPELGLLLEIAKSLSLLSRTDFLVLLTVIIGKPNVLQLQDHIYLGA